MLRSLASCAVLTAVALSLGIPAAHAQDAQQGQTYDGYCYVRSDDMVANSNTASCLNGEYYAYTDGYRPAPRAPRDYQVEYFTHRPSHDVYSQVYNASTLTANFDPGARNHFGNAGGDQYADQDRQGYGDVQPGAVTQGAVNPQNRVWGWRDDGGAWHEGQPAALGWLDMKGRWHEGQVAAYGWQDDQGNWHDNGTSTSGN